MKHFLTAFTMTALTLATSAALAQTVQSTPPVKTTNNSRKSKRKQPEKLQEIMVTGSAIPRTSLETAAPVQVITAEQIKASGFTSVDQVVRTVSADNSGSIPNSFQDGFAAGASGVALRGLTAAATLVLVDGHRVADYPVADDGTRSFQDLNTLPLEAVQSIQVLKDGASSIYGADAIGGVVNIILKPTFRGATVHVGVGGTQHGGGFEKTANGMFGTGSLHKNGYNAYFDFSYQNDNQILAGQRSFPFNTDDLSSIGYLDQRAGNPENFTGSTYGSVAPATLGTPGNLLTGVQIPGTLFQPL